MRRVDCVIVGAGHAGLAFSACLTEKQIEHVVLERGDIASAWRHQRWDSLRLLTPNWQSRLPGYTWRGAPPDDFMSASEVADFVTAYASVIDAPVQTATTVVRASIAGEGFHIETSRGRWHCRTLVIASGAFAQPVIPTCAAQLSPSITQLSSLYYRNPEQLPDGGVLVVGASASGLQIADELQHSGREVVLSVGEHVRMPRHYRNVDIQYWLEVMGLLDERFNQVEDLQRLRRLPSPQLTGNSAQRIFDLNSLTDGGVELAGRVVASNGNKVQFSGALHNYCMLADLKLQRLVRRIDDWVEQHGLNREFAETQPFAPTRVAASAPLGLDLRQRGINTIIWATGLRPDYSWLDMPAFDHKGALNHEGGAVCVPGVYAMGLPFMRRRKSSFIHGAEEDARELATQLTGYLASITTPALRAAGGLKRWACKSDTSPC